MLNYKDETLYDSEGAILKALSCPLKLSRDDLQMRSDGNFDCSSCHRKILNTSVLTEAEIVSELRSNPDQCIAIDLRHPAIEVVE